MTLKRTFLLLVAGRLFIAAVVQELSRQGVLPAADAALVVHHFGVMGAMESAFHGYQAILLPLALASMVDWCALGASRRAVGFGATIGLVRAGVLCTGILLARLGGLTTALACTGLVVGIAAVDVIGRGIVGSSPDAVRASWTRELVRWAMFALLGLVLRAGLVALAMVSLTSSYAVAVSAVGVLCLAGLRLVWFSGGQSERRP